MSVDLHTHSTFSDGTMTPEELVTHAANNKLKAIALTDHDEIAGNRPALKAAKSKFIELVPGCEFSIDEPMPGSAHLHMLGLFLDVENDRLNETLSELREARQKRVFDISDRLRSEGIDISREELERVIGPGSAGRPHIARLLIEKGVVSNVWDAFHKWLSKGRPGYVAKKKLKLQQAIDLIHEAGGLAILAHPVSLKHRRYKDCEAHIREMREMGMDGVEAYYSGHTRNFTNFLLNVARRHGMVVSGGSDFHGTVKPDVEIGSGKGRLQVPDDVLISLKNALNKRQ